MIMNIPVEIVLKIVSYLHKLTTYRHYERYMQVAWFRIKTTEVILEVRKYDESSRNVTTAKNLRLVSSDFAYAYGPAYIHEHIGGTLMRKPYSIVLAVNNYLSKIYLMEDFAYYYLNALKEGTKRIGKKNGETINERSCGCIFCRGNFWLVRSYYIKFPSDVVDKILGTSPMLIYNNEYVDNLLTDYQKKLDFESLYPSNLPKLTPELKLYLLKSYYQIFNRELSQKVGSEKTQTVVRAKKTKLPTLEPFNPKKNNLPSQKLKYNRNTQKIMKFQNYKPIKGNQRRFKIR